MVRVDACGGVDHGAPEHKKLMDSLPEKTNRVILVGDLLQGSREFLLAWSLLHSYQQFSRPRGGAVPPIFHANATCLGFSLELALKARVALDGGSPPKRGPDAHSYVALFTKYLSIRAQEELAGLVKLAPDGRAATPAELLELVLKQFEGTFLTFRYVHEPLRERGEVVFHERDLLNVVLAVHESIIRIRSDLRNWAGVLYDPADEARSAGEILDRLTVAYRAALLG